MESVLNVTVYVTDIRAFHDIADIRLRYFPKDGPASAIVEVSRLARPELMIEISAIAAVP
jgi:2-iminobutanoate/2-iminopropanoate deaminase